MAFNVCMIQFIKFVFIRSVPSIINGAKGIIFSFLSSVLFRLRIVDKI